LSPHPLVLNKALLGSPTRPVSVISSNTVPQQTSGWQGDIPRVGQSLIASFPVATNGRASIVSPSREEFVDRGTGTWLGALTYPAATLDLVLRAGVLPLVEVVTSGPVGSLDVGEAGEGVEAEEADGVEAPVACRLLCEPEAVALEESELEVVAAVLNRAERERCVEAPLDRAGEAGARHSKP
jgi:hypothetical protein